MKSNLPSTADRKSHFVKASKNAFVIGFFLLISFCGFAQTVIHNETFPNQFNVNFGTSNSSNGTFAGSTGTWTSSVNSNSLCAIAVIPAYYSPVTNAIKIVNWNTAGKGAADAHAASPTVNLSGYTCSPSLNLTFQLYTYTVNSADPTSFFKVEFSADNGSTWTSVWERSSAQLFSTYGANGLTNISVPIAAAYRVSGFKYRFSGYKPANQANNFYLFVDDAKITATACPTSCLIGGVNLGSLTNYLFVFTNGSTDANWQSASKGYIGNVAIDGIQAAERTSGTFAYAGTIFSNDASLNAWGSIVSNNSGQAFSSLNQTSLLAGLETDLNNAFTQINALPVSVGYDGIAPTALNGLNKQNSIAETFVINVNSGFQVSTQINITGDANDVFILRWDSDKNFSNGYNGQVKFQSGGAIVPLGGLKPSNFINIAGDINASGGGANPPAPYPQGPRTNNGTGTLITGGSDFAGGGFFTGYWLTTGDPTSGYTTAPESNAIFVGGWYSSTTKFSMTSGTSGVYVAPVCASGTGSIGDRVWLDADGDGIQDASETGGLTGITVQLKNSVGTVIATTTTNASGNYLFSGLAAGTYKVVFPISISGAIVTAQNVGGNDDIDSDASQTTGETGNIVLGSGQNITNVDAGYCPTTLQIGNRVFNDINNNGIDNGEAAISGATVNLYKDDNNDNIPDGAAIATTTTNATGNYAFINLGPGNYIVGVTPPAGYTSSTNAAIDPDNDIDLDDNGTNLVGSEWRGLAITLVGGTEPGVNTNNTYDFGFYLPQSCNGKVTNLYFNELNGGPDLPITNGATFTIAQLGSLYNMEAGTSGTIGSVKYTITGPTPTSNIENFAPYNSPGTGSGPWTGAEGNYSVNLKTYNAADAGGTLCHDTTITFILTSTLTLGNRVWYDTDNDGINDATENGIRNVSVKLYLDANNDNVPDGASIASTTTDVNGNYSFAGLSAGNYIVGVVIPNGYMSSSINGGDPDNNIDLDDNGQVLSGNEIRGLAITLSAGSEPGGNTNNTYDFGLLPDCSCVNSAGNLVVNPSFENGTTGWSWSGGTLTTGTGYVACGAANGFNNWSSGTSKVWQDVTNASIVAGSTVTFSAFAGTHAPGIACSPKLSLIFLNSSNVVIGQTDVTVTRVVGDYNDQLENYSITAIAPAGTVKARVQSSITCNTMKLDAFCLTAVAPLTACLGDRVWKDDNSNGIQDPGEVGVAGVTLVLLNAAGQPIATTTTDAFGNYKFCGLPAGDYSVRVTPPANYTLSPKNQGADTTKNSDFDPVSYTTGTVTLGPGQIRTDIDGGLKFSQPQPASVGDRVWYDINGDGIQDANEPGVSNVLVTLYNSSGVAVASMYTDANGLYLFTNVAPGNYTVGVSLPPAMVFSPNNGAVSIGNNSDINPANGRTASFTVNAGDQIRYVDAGLKTQVSTNASVGDFVWNDLNKDGIQDAGEPGIPGVVVRLVDTLTNTVVATTVTDVNGKYIFNDVTPGGYQVEFVTPAGYTTTTKLNTNVTTSATDSDVDPGTGRSAKFGLAAGQRITTVDAGYWVTTAPGTGKIGDRVWHDANQNGIQDAGEPNVSGVTVTLYDAGGVAIKQATTDQNGNYIFTDLAAGNYTVGFSNLPDGYTFTTQGLGTAATGSDANPATGRTATIVLGVGETNLDVDAGIRSAKAGTGSLGNRVWYDVNNNGLQDAGEVGVQGATVELLDAAGNPVDKDPIAPGVQPTITTTNALGEYLFTGLGAGDYRVRFSTLPAGYAAVAKGAGTDRNLDSDGNPIAVGSSTTDVIGLAENEERLDIDLGIFNPTAPLGNIGDRVWFDANNNGIQDGTEQGVPGVSVALLNSSGVTIATTVTDKDGLYKFVNLADATYSVQFSNLPAGFGFSPKDNGVDNLDSDADPVTGKTGSYVISGGNTNLTVDAGIFSTRAALGDYVWFDANKDGIQDATESGIAGVTVILYDAAGAPVTSMITDQNGRYFFSNLNPGTYTVGFSTTPGKLVFTLRDVVAAGDAADSDVDPATGKTGSYTLVAGQVNLTVDAGLKPVIPASVGDFVWFDLNRNGIQDAGEPGVPGVIATLYNSAGQVLGSAVTDGNGYYLINNVPPGTGYYVQFSNQPDPAAPWTTQNVGGTAATDNSKADATGTTTSFNVAEGENVTNIDGGLYRLINLSGNVWHDANALLDNLVNQTNFTLPIPTGLRVYLINGSTGLIERSVIIPATGPNAGKFNFNNISVNTVYRVYLTNVFIPIGSPEPGTPTIVPGGWQHTGQKNANPPNNPLGSDGVNDGRVTVPGSVNNIININFGIKPSGGDVVQG